MKASELSAVIDTEKVVEHVKELLAKGEALLSTQGENAKPEVAQELRNLGDAISLASEAFAYAVTANELLSELQRQLAHRADAYSQVFGDLCQVSKMGFSYFPKARTLTFGVGVKTPTAVELDDAFDLATAGKFM